MTFLLIIMLIRLLILLAEMLAKEFRDRKINYNFKINTTMFRRFIPNRIVNWERLFEDHFVNVKVLFAMRFNAIPSITYIGELEITKAFSFLKERYRNEVLSILQHSYFDHDKGELFCNNTVFVLNNARMIEIAGNYVHILFTSEHFSWATELAKELAVFRQEPAENANARPPAVVGFARATTLN